MADALNTLVWFQTKDGEQNRNRPKSFVAMLMGIKPQNDYEGFDSGEDFEAARRRILEGK